MGTLLAGCYRRWGHCYSWTRYQEEREEGGDPGEREDPGEDTKTKTQLKV